MCVKMIMGFVLVLSNVCINSSQPPQSVDTKKLLSIDAGKLSSKAEILATLICNKNGSFSIQPHKKEEEPFLLDLDKGIEIRPLSLVSGQSKPFSITAQKEERGTDSSIRTYNITSYQEEESQFPTPLLFRSEDVSITEKDRHNSDGMREGKVIMSKDNDSGNGIVLSAIFVPIQSFSDEQLCLLDDLSKSFEERILSVGGLKFLISLNQIEIDQGLIDDARQRLTNKNDAYGNTEKLNDKPAHNDTERTLDGQKPKQIPLYKNPFVIGVSLTAIVALFLWLKSDAIKSFLYR